MSGVPVKCHVAVTFRVAKSMTDTLLAWRLET